MTKAHEAKGYALSAWLAGRLSATAERRIRRHVERCATCAAYVRGARVFEAIKHDVVTGEPEVDFGRIELALRREARAAVHGQRGGRARGVALALAAAAAIGLLVLPKRTEAPGPVTAREPITSTAAARVPATITALQGDATVRGPGASARTARLGMELVEGEAIELAPSAAAHLALSATTGFALDEAARVTLLRSRAEATALELAQGRVTSLVRELGAAERYEVRAAGHFVVVRGTLFSVRAVDGQLEVDVAEGRVEVTDAQGRPVASLGAPASFTTRAPARAPAPARLGTPWLPPGDTPGSATLVLPRLAGAQAFVFGKTSFPASGELSMRVPTGELTLEIELADGLRKALVLQILEGGLHVEEDVLRRLARHDDAKTRAPEPFAGELIARVVQRATPELERCYERSLKLQPEVLGRFTLRITLDPRGQVTRVRARDGGEAVPAELLQCLSSATRRLRFPAPGGSGVTFDAPIRLSRR